MTATFIPDGAAAKLPGARGVTGCLRCLLGDLPAAGTTATCDTAGVIGPAVTLVSSIAAAEAIKLIVGRGKLNAGLIHVDVWEHEYEQFGGLGRRADCPACGLRRFEFLSAQVGATTASLCGRDAVQVAIAGGGRLDLARLEQQMAPVAHKIARNDYLLRRGDRRLRIHRFPR